MNSVKVFGLVGTTIRLSAIDHAEIRATFNSSRLTADRGRGQDDDGRAAEFSDIALCAQERNFSNRDLHAGHRFGAHLRKLGIPTNASLVLTHHLHRLKLKLASATIFRLRNAATMGCRDRSRTPLLGENERADGDETDSNNLLHRFLQ